jgi:hypothetical protein
MPDESRPTRIPRTNWGYFGEALAGLVGIPTFFLSLSVYLSISGSQDLKVAPLALEPVTRLPYLLPIVVLFLGFVIACVAASAPSVRRWLADTEPNDVREVRRFAFALMTLTAVPAMVISMAIKTYVFMGVLSGDFTPASARLSLYICPCFVLFGVVALVGAVVLAAPIRPRTGAEVGVEAAALDAQIAELQGRLAQLADPDESPESPTFPRPPGVDPCPPPTP